MKKLIIILAVVLIVGIIGFVYYELNSPFSADDVNIPQNIGTLSLEKSEKMHGKILFGTDYIPGNQHFAGWCMYSSYKPNPSLDTIYACESEQNPSQSLDLWIASDKNFLSVPEPGAISFTVGELTINSINVKTITISDENCGNPGYCTRYYWTQGKLIFKSDGNLELVKGFIEENKGLF